WRTKTTAGNTGRKTVLAVNAQIYRTRKATLRRDGNSVCSRSSGDYILCRWTNGNVKVRAGGKYFYCPRRWVWIRVARSIDHCERDRVRPVCTECDITWILRC